MKKINTQPRFLPLSISIIAATISLPTLSQDAPTGPQLEVQYVTAQKRTESLLDVPLSVVAIEGDKLADASIETLEDLTAFVPNIHFTETGFSTQVRIRGIGSDNSQGLEQSVGMYVDGIYFGRAQLFRTPMMDMERVEVLRGPQSVLFGKNTIAGALNLTTARPTDEFEGSLRLMNEFEHNQVEWNGVLNVPITDTLAARLAIRDYTEDGYFTNTTKNRDESQADESTVRLSLKWDARDDLSFFLKAERNEFNTVGRPIELTYGTAAPSVAPPPIGGNTYPTILAALGQPASETNQDFRRQYEGPETSDNTAENIVFSVDYGINDHTLSLVSGFLQFDYDEFCDCDNSPAEILNVELYEDYEQFSQEIRISSPADQTIEWIAGAFYQTWDQSFQDNLALRPQNFLTSVVSSFPGSAALALMSDTGLRRDFEQTSDAWAIFAQATWSATERLHFTLGARFTDEEKEGRKVLDLFTPSTGEPLVDPTVGLVYLGVFGAENEQATGTLIPDGEGGVIPIALPYSGHNAQQSRSETAFTPFLNAEFDLNENVMLYATYTEGFKAGGFDPRSNQLGTFTVTDPAGIAAAAGQPDPEPYRWFEFEEETATSYELGMKSSLVDGRGEINVALYWMDYDDLQISQFDGAIGFNPSNAKETRTRGLELDGRWALTDSLTGSYGFSWLDFEYLDFENGNCYQGQTDRGTEDIDGDGSFDLCSYTGLRGAYTPDYTLNLTLDYEQELNSQMRLRSFIDVQRVDGHQVHVNLDPAGEIDAYTMVSARIGLEGDNWMIGLLGKNLLDEYIISYSANAPLSGSSFATNTFYSTVRRPRTYAIEGQISF